MTIIYLPKFKEGLQFRKLKTKPFITKYRFKISLDIFLQSNSLLIPLGQKLEFKDKKGKVWLTIYPHVIKIHEGYAWNGCSPKIGLFKFWIGPPDLENTILAPLVHDARIQCHKEKDFPWKREQCDDVFKNILDFNKFKLRKIYCAGPVVWSILKNSS